MSLFSINGPYSLPINNIPFSFLPKCTVAYTNIKDDVSYKYWFLRVKRTVSNNPQGIEGICEIVDNHDPNADILACTITNSKLTKPGQYISIPYLQAPNGDNTYCLPRGSFALSGSAVPNSELFYPLLTYSSIK